MILSIHFSSTSLSQAKKIICPLTTLLWGNLKELLFLSLFRFSLVAKIGVVNICYKDVSKNLVCKLLWRQYCIGELKLYAFCKSYGKVFKNCFYREISKNATWSCTEGKKRKKRKKNIGVMPSKWSTCRSGYYLKVQEQENKQALKSHQICEEATNGRDK